MLFLAISASLKPLACLLWCPSDTSTQLNQIWNGPHPEDGLELEVRDETPPGFPWPELPEEPQICAPGEIDPDMLSYYAKKLG